MDYLLYTIEVSDPEQQEILIARLAEAGFDSFSQEEEQLLAYIPADLADEDAIAALLDSPSFFFTVEAIGDRNWNEEWEKNYPPVTVRGECYIRAPFHPHDPDVKYEILIEPKMSFGTAHHETTSLMIEWLLDAELNGKKVLDMGCGTAVLAILAEMRGAAKLLAVDNDEWAYRNSLENIARNNCRVTDVILGDVSSVTEKGFDTLLANINRNILLQDLPAYAELMASPAELYMSGFYEADLPAIRERAESLGLQFAGSLEKNHWMAVKFTR
jgi:ribosomal protein L11 methyltransferase